MIDHSIYLHIPFCQKRCAYCDFNTWAGKGQLIPAYVEALCKEVRGVAASSPERIPVKSIYFGGGTPSLLDADQLQKIFDALRQGFELLPDCETTMEANPGTVSLDYFQRVRALGVNRLSLGVQSSSPEELRFLGRIHDYLDAIKAIEWARQAGFDNISLDLIFGIPGQSLESWKRTLALATNLNVEHLSLYALTIEEGTPLGRWVSQGAVSIPDDDLAADMYEWAEIALEDAGYQHYEISNWGKRLGENRIASSRHNLQYWRNLPYLGLGAGAHGSTMGYRTENVHSIEEYIQCMDTDRQVEFPFSPATKVRTPIDPWIEIQETMIMGLRLVDEGVSRQQFLERFGKPIGYYYERDIDELQRKGLLEDSGAAGDRLRLTRRGRLLGNHVFVHFVGGKEPEIASGVSKQ
ncbi:MAG: radical SAM family heme chaperone HemW [Anaerolineaceae bacterium]|jgi:oxygen-independent coproporphyrinogen-3 oxidase